MCMDLNNVMAPSDRRIPFDILGRSFDFHTWATLSMLFVYGERLWWVDLVVFGLNNTLATFLNRPT